MVRFLPLLAVLLAWAPNAFAVFPPCPRSPMRLVSLDNGTSSQSETPWFIAEYTEMPHAIGNPDTPKTGKCEDQRTVVDGNLSSGSLLLNPAYASKADFGIIALPNLPEMDIDSRHLQYSLDFDVDTAALANSGDWFDMVQLDFARSVTTDGGAQGSRSAVYRVRKAAHRKGHAMIEVIESRESPDDIAVKPPLIDTVVATIPLPTDMPMASMRLRWTQNAPAPLNGEPNPPILGERRIDTVLDVIGPDNKVLYTTKLPGLWADTLSIGLLDYNAPNFSANGPSSDVYLDEVWFSATTVEK
jgi:hypothetical protein